MRTNIYSHGVFYINYLHLNSKHVTFTKSCLINNKKGVPRCFLHDRLNQTFDSCEISDPITYER